MKKIKINKTKFLNIRISQDELLNLKETAKLKKIHYSKIVRQAIINFIENAA